MPDKALPPQGMAGEEENAFLVIEELPPHTTFMSVPCAKQLKISFLIQASKGRFRGAGEESK